MIAIGLLKAKMTVKRPKKLLMNSGVKPRPP
jgi:hypothetical protein